MVSRSLQETNIPYHSDVPSVPCKAPTIDLSNLRKRVSNVRSNRRWYFEDVPQRSTLAATNDATDSKRCNCNGFTMHIFLACNASSGKFPSDWYDLAHLMKNVLQILVPAEFIL